jgi:ketosteroid isomerase-like protein
MCYKVSVKRTFAAAVVVLSAIGVHAQAPGAPGSVPMAPPAPGVPAAAAASAASASAAKAEQEVRKAEADRFEAMVKADAGALEKLLAPEVSYTHSNAQVQDKSGFIADIRSKAIRYLSIEPTDTHVVVLGTTAVVTGLAAIHVTENGSDLTLKVRYTNVHVNRRGEWQMVAWQATPLPQ